MMMAWELAAQLTALADVVVALAVGMACLVSWRSGDPGSMA